MIFENSLQSCCRECGSECWLICWRVLAPRLQPVTGNVQSGALSCCTPDLLLLRQTLCSTGFWCLLIQISPQSIFSKCRFTDPVRIYWIKPLEGGIWALLHNKSIRLFPPLHIFRCYLISKYYIWNTHKWMFVLCLFKHRAQVLPWWSSG